MQRLSERAIQKKLFLKIGSRKDVRIFRNNVGMAYMGKVIYKTPLTIKINNYRVVKFGLIKGSGDLIGWKSVEVTPEMVGKKIAVFLSVETKRTHGRRSPEQINWAKQVQQAGGIAIFVEDTDSIEI